MIEVHDLPTADVYSGVYSEYVNNIKGDDKQIDKLVLLERTGKLESGIAGKKMFVQISRTYLQNKPVHGALIAIDSITYKILNPVKRTNPVFIDFWESEIQIAK